LNQAQKLVESRIAVMLRTTSAATAKRESDFAELSVATAGGLAFALVAIFFCVVPLSGNATSTRDYVVFWATGQQLVHHANPYDPAAMDGLERAAGLASGYGILYMRNPPLALPLALPLGLVSARIGALLWSLVLMACLVFSARLIREMHGNPANRIHWIAFAFAPSLICLLMGQTALFALLGLALFLRFHRTWPLLAGSSLWLCSIKPHLFLPFAVVLLAWVFFSKSYQILAGSAIALVASLALTWLVAPTAWSGYWAMMSAPAIEREFIPCLSVAMRQWLRNDAVWLQYLPSLLACVWAIAHYWRRRSQWDWLQDGSILILVSLIAAPYCWPYDQAIAVPAILTGAYTTRSRPMLATIALINIPIMGALMIGIKITTPFYLFIAPLWLAWYLLARSTANVSSPIADSTTIVESASRELDPFPGVKAE
jgi:hypothetical protein